MKDLRVVFFGTPLFAREILDTLIQEKYNVIAAVSQPDKPVGRKHKIVPTPIHEYCESHGILTLQPERLKEAAAEVLALNPDLIMTCAYGQLVPDEILNFPKFGCLNIHPSLLPKYRGGAPVHRAIMNGDEETGVCLMEMVHRMDAGRVYACEHVPIDETDTTETLNRKLEKTASEMIREKLPLYLDGKLEGKEQDESQKTIARNISAEEEFVRFQETDLKVLYDHIRACIDWPIAYGRIDGKRMKFYAVSKEVKEHSEQAGTIIGFDKKSMIVACNGGFLHVQELQAEGKNRMPASAFANGAGRNLIGKVFE